MTAQIQDSPVLAMFVSEWGDKSPIRWFEIPENLRNSTAAGGLIGANTLTASEISDGLRCLQVGDTWTDGDTAVRRIR